MLDQFNQALRQVPPWIIYLLCFGYTVWLFYLGSTGGLGVEPIKELEHRLGKIALQLLVLGLAVTPLRRFLRLNLLRFRRAIGLMAFFFVSLHLLVWLVLDVQILEQILADIIKRPYVTIGMAGFVVLLPLALTSNGWSVRRLGPWWRRLHKLTYLAVLLGGIHYVWLVKGIQLEPVVYFLVTVVLLALRIPFRRNAVRRVPAESA